MNVASERGGRRVARVVFFPTVEEPRITRMARMTGLRRIYGVIFLGELRVLGVSHSESSRGGRAKTPRIGADFVAALFALLRGTVSL